MATNDLDQVVEIERETLSAWSRADLAGEFEQPGGVQLAAREPISGKVLGHLCARTGADEAEIMKLAVSSQARRQGVATGLLRNFLDLLKRMGTSHCYLELRASNQAALYLYRKNGFIETGLRKKYYSAPEEPAILMTNTLLS